MCAFTAALAIAASLAIALQESSVWADGEACVDVIDTELGTWILYLETTGDHMVKGEDVKADGAGVVINSVTQIDNTFDYMGHAIVTLPANHKVYKVKYNVTDISSRLWFCFHESIGFWNPISLENWHSYYDNSDSGIQGSDDSGNSDDGNSNVGNNNVGNTNTNKNPGSNSVNTISNNVGNNNGGTGNNDGGTGNNDGGTSNNDGGTSNNNGGTSNNNDENNNDGGDDPNSDTQATSTTPISPISEQATSTATTTIEKTATSTKRSSNQESSELKSAQSKSETTSVSTKSETTTSGSTSAITKPTPVPTTTPKPPYTGDANWSGLLFVVGGLLLVGGLVMFNLRFAPAQTWADRRGTRPMQFLSW